MDFATYVMIAAFLLLVAGKVLVALQAFRVHLFWGFVVLGVPFGSVLFVVLVLA